jgi:thiamine pyrophosphate-dependent acetolactate synthase large subunit-like protein
MGPVAIVVDEKMQEEHAPFDARIPTLNVPTPPAADSGAIAEVAELLVAAENPVIVASRAARTPEGLRLMVELAEVLQAGVVDSRRRLNFPTRHPLSGGSARRRSSASPRHISSSAAITKTSSATRKWTWPWPRTPRRRCRR